MFDLNPHYTETKPKYSRVVLQNVDGPTQKINVQAGQAQVALDLNADQVKDLGSGSTKLVKGTSPNVFYLWLNQNPDASGGITNRPEFVTAVRHGIDYGSIVGITGPGSTQPGGMVPSQFIGAIKPDQTNSFNVSGRRDVLSKPVATRAKQFLFHILATLLSNGISFQTLAEAIQSQLKTVGIALSLQAAALLDLHRRLPRRQAAGRDHVLGPRLPRPG